MSVPPPLPDTPPDRTARIRPESVALLAAFIPTDRRATLATGGVLPDEARGAALLADLSGFTPLTEIFATAYGPQRGAEELTRLLNQVFTPLISAVHAYGGSVISLAGDALICWFDSGPAEADRSALPLAAARAVACAHAQQAAMAAYTAIPLPTGATATLTLKVAVASGPVRRFVVGSPTIQVLDVLAGTLLTRLAYAEQLAHSGEVLVDSPTAEGLRAEAGLEPQRWRHATETRQRFRVLSRIPTRPLPPIPAVDVPTFVSYSPTVIRPWILPAVWERVVRGQEQFLAEMRPAVLLFLHFAGIDYDADPKAGAKLDTYIRWAQAVLIRYDAHILQLIIGDKGSYLYASFGAPVAHTDDAARAAAAALELRTSPAQCGYIGAVQIGMSRGHVWAGAYGGQDRRTYGILGDAVNIAARLMQVAPVGGILCTAPVRQSAGERFRWRDLPAMQVKGKQAAIAVTVLEAAGSSAQSGLGEPVYQTPFIGRHTELAALTRSLTHAHAGAGRIVGIVGDAGVGKSRLLAEVMRSAQATGFAVYAGAGQSYGTVTPYLAWHAIWRTFFGIDPDEQRDTAIRATLETRLAATHPHLIPRLPLLGAVLGQRLTETALTAAMEPALRKASLESLLVECIQAAAARQPILLVVEDAHWLDPPARDLVEILGRAITEVPVLLLLAYRPLEGESPPAPPLPVALTRLAHCIELRLTVLAPGDAAALVAARLGMKRLEDVPTALLEGLLARADGNPFYLEELLNYLVELGIHHQDTRALEGLEWPSSLQTLVLARLDQLTEEQRTVLKVASIIGRLFRVRQLWGVHPALGPSAEVESALQVLDRRDLTLLESATPDLTYRFKHIITREVTYGSLPFQIRARLHEQFADWLETISRTAGTPVPVNLLAYHYGESENLAKQREYFHQGAAAAAADYAHPVAVHYYERLLALTATEEQGPIRLALATVLERTGDWAAAGRHYGTVLDCGQTADNHLLIAQAQQGLGVVRQHQGSYAESESWLQQAQTAFTELGDRPGVSAVLAQLGQLYERQGHYRQAQTVLADSLALSRAEDDRMNMALALHNLGTIAYQQGDYETARTLYAEGLTLRQALGDKAGIAKSLNNLAVIAYTQENPTQAQHLWEQSLALAREIGAKSSIASTLNNLGALVYAQEDYGRARTLREESLRLSQEMGAQSGMAIALNNLGMVALRLGDYPTAQTQFRASLTIQRAVGMKRLTVDSLLGLAYIAAQHSHGRYAGMLLAAATQLLTDLGAALEAPEVSLYQATESLIRGALAAQPFAAVLAAGRALSWEAAITYASADTHNEGEILIGPEPGS